MRERESSPICVWLCVGWGEVRKSGRRYIATKREREFDIILPKSVFACSYEK